MSSAANRTLRLLFYVEQNYSFDILRPLQAEALARGHEVRWFLLQDASATLMRTDELLVTDVRQAIQFAPDVVFAPGDRVPGFIPGLKVQVFHGLNEEKRGTRYPERGLFDLFCTEGSARTEMLSPLARERGYFKVVETGWLKLDTLFSYAPTATTYDRPQILFASTFTPSLSCAEALYPAIRALSQSPNWQWLVTLHPKMAPKTVQKYQRLENDNLTFFGTERVIELQHRADIMISDNSSVLQEFLLLKKPVVTYRNRDPQPFLIDIQEPEQLQPAIEQALQPDPELVEAINNYGPSVTPWLDGASAARVMNAVEKMIASGWQDKKPANLWRNFKMRRQLQYFRL